MMAVEVCAGRGRGRGGHEVPVPAREWARMREA